MEIEKKLCQQCKERYLKYYNGAYTNFCLICTNENLRNYHKTNKKEIATKKNFSYKSCKKCNKNFEGYKSQVYCHNPCSKKKTIEEENHEWTKKEINLNEKKPRKDGNKIAYSFFRKKYGVSKRFQACRG